MTSENTRLTAKEVALIICFTALYAVFAAIPIFKIVGAAGTISAAAITAPIIGILLGPYLGFLSAILGATIGFFYGSFSPMSFVSGTVATLCAGLLCEGKRALCFMIYFLFFVIHGFYPSIGPVWLFPSYLWFQLAGLLLLISPLQSSAIRNLKSNNIPVVFFSFFAVSLTSTLAGQISGSLTFLVLFPNPPIVQLGVLQLLTVQYPVERTIVALSSSFIGTSLFRILKPAKLLALGSQEHAKG